MFCCTRSQPRVLNVIMSLHPQVSVSDTASMRVHVLLLWECSTVFLEVLVMMPARANIPPSAVRYLQGVQHHKEIRFSCGLSFWCTHIIVLSNLQSSSSFPWKHSGSTRNKKWKKKKHSHMMMHVIFEECSSTVYSSGCDYMKLHFHIVCFYLWHKQRHNIKFPAKRLFNI